MTPLKVSDLKHGDVVRIDLLVTGVDSDGDAVVELPARRRDAWLSDADLAAGNAELVVRPRPVRKGDQLLTDGDTPVHFLVVHGAYAVCWHEGGPIHRLASTMRHMDNAPIDWEASA